MSVQALLLLWIGSIILAAIIGHLRGHSWINATTFGVVLGPLGVLIAAALPPEKDPTKQR